MKHLFTLSVFVVIALAFWGMQAYEKNRDVAVTEESDPHFVDVFMRNFKLTAMGEDGKPNFTMQADLLEHYNDSTSSIVLKPLIHLLQDGNLWVISAQKAEIDDENSRIILSGDVLMQQQSTDTPVELKTNELEIDTVKQVARSNQTVYIVQKEFNLQSEGMILDNVSGKLELLASVEGTYVPQKK